LCGAFVFDIATPSLSFSITVINNNAHIRALGMTQLSKLLQLRRPVLLLLWLHTTILLMPGVFVCPTKFIISAEKISTSSHHYTRSAPIAATEREAVLHTSAPSSHEQQQEQRFLQTGTPGPSPTAEPSSNHSTAFPSDAPSSAPSIDNSTSIDWQYENIVALRWKIENPPDVSYSGLQFDLHFTVSDFITESLVRYDLYEGSSCGYAGDIITNAGYVTGNVVPDNTPTGGGLTTRIITLENNLVPENITKSNSYVESGTDATISYCIRFELWDGPVSDPEALRINHQDVTVSLALDLTDEFTISAQNVVARDRTVQTSDDEFFVEAFICEEATGLPPQDTVPILQGQTVRVTNSPSYRDIRPKKRSSTSRHHQTV
jgi:hypothetical protein